MKSLALLLIAFATLFYAGCGPSPRDLVPVVDLSPQLEAAKAVAEFHKTNAAAWKASDARKAQQLADQGKTVADLQTAVTNLTRENADGAVREDQAKSDLKQAVIVQERYRAAVWCFITAFIAIAAYALSDYFTSFQWVLRPTAYVSIGVCIAAFIWRAIVPYVTSIESGLLILIGLTGIYELDVHTPVGNWLKWLLGKVEGLPVVGRLFTAVDNTALKAEADAKAAAADFAKKI